MTYSSGGSVIVADVCYLLSVTKGKFPLGRGRAEVNTAHLLVAFHIHLDLHTYVIDAQLRNRCILAYFEVHMLHSSPGSERRRMCSCSTVP